MTNKDPDQRLTPAERALILQRFVERQEWQKYLSDHNLLAALKLGATLKARKAN